MQGLKYLNIFLFRYIGFAKVFVRKETYSTRLLDLEDTHNDFKVRNTEYECNICSHETSTEHL